MPPTLIDVGNVLLNTSPEGSQRKIPLAICRNDEAARNGHIHGIMIRESTAGSLRVNRVIVICRGGGQNETVVREASRLASVRGRVEDARMLRAE